MTAAECGAVSTFIGTTRNTFEGKKVVRLEYDAYIPMALKVMKVGRGQASCRVQQHAVLSTEV